MRVLITGCTFLQVRASRRPISKIDVPESIYHTLTELGHEVDWRQVRVGEDLSDYDVAWVCLAPINSLNARKGALGALWTLSERRALPAVGFFDDWQCPNVFNSFRSLFTHPERLYKQLYGERFYVGEPTDEGVRPYEDELIRTAGEMLGPAWERIVAVGPMYRWGDRAKIMRRMPKEMGEMLAIDPSSTVYESMSEVSVPDTSDKRLRWLLAALMPHGDWLAKQQLTWDVDVIGSRKLKAPRLKTEQDVMGEYARHWGAMSPPYWSAGGGWWRSRFLYAARFKTVLVCDKGEATPLGDAYSLDIRAVERMEPNELELHAAAQATALRRFATTKDDWQKDILTALDAAKERA